MVLRAVEYGHKRNEFDGLDHLRATMAEYATRKTATKPTVRGQEAYEALFRTKEFQALPEKARKALRLLAKGESFHSNLI